MGSIGANNSFSLTTGQQAYESRIRNSDIEYGAYFDANGNVLAEGKGNRDEVEFDGAEINHNVEQRVWNDEEVNFTHNHPENTIFSTDDIEAFETMENHSLRAVLPNGKSYTLIREQPRTERVYEYDPAIGDFKNIGYEGKKIAPAYDKEYSKVYDDRYRQLRKQLWTLSSEEYNRQEQALLRDVTSHMSKWLRKNARKYGYRFEEN